MKLWLLRPVDDLPRNDDPWDPYYDKAHGFVIRAETEERARQIANKNGHDEVCDERVTPRLPTCDPWLYVEYSSCVELFPEGDEDVIMMDYHAG